MDTFLSVYTTFADNSFNLGLHDSAFMRTTQYLDQELSLVIMTI